MDKNLKHYIDAISVAKTMLQKGIIKDEDFTKIDVNLKQKYCINNNNLYCSIDLIYTLFRGNMCANEGGAINGENS